MSDQEIFATLARLADQGIPVCLATIVGTAGHTPRDVGAKMLVAADGWTLGSVGGGCGENRARSAALRCLLGPTPTELIEVDLTDDLGTRGGDVCGGTMWIFLDATVGR